MVVGNGMLAKAFGEFEHDPRHIIFASGVSDSLETRESAFQREADLLRHQLQSAAGRRLVYLSTSGVEDDSVNSRPYFQHKLSMEAMVQESAEEHLVLRLSHVVGPTGNPKNIINYLVANITEGRPFSLWARAERNLIDVDDVVAISSELLLLEEVSPPVSIACPRSWPMMEIVKHIEACLGRSSKHQLEQKGSPLRIDTSFIDAHCPSSNRLTEPEYLPNLIKKYYGQT